MTTQPDGAGDTWLSVRYQVLVSTFGSHVVTQSSEH